MAPFSEFLSKRQVTSGAADGRTRINEETPMMISPWVIVAIILGVSVVILIAVFVVLHFMKTRRAAKENEQVPLFSDQRQLIRRKRKMTVQDRIEAEELERSLMIRKSLASRTTINTVASRDSQMIQSTRTSRTSEFLDDYPADAAAQIQTIDWKEWEAQVQQDRRHSRLKELAKGGHAHPALSHEMEDMAIPPQARVPSSSQGVTSPMHALPLSTLPTSPTIPPPPYRQTPSMSRAGKS